MSRFECLCAACSSGGEFLFLCLTPTAFASSTATPNIDAGAAIVTTSPTAATASSATDMATASSDTSLVASIIDVTSRTLAAHQRKIG